MSTYIFDNAAPQTGQRFSSLESLFDAWSFQHLATTGVDEGWRCLELGAGGGSIAGWLAERVGTSGYVLATDIDTRYLSSQPVAHFAHVDVRSHNIVSDPVPTAEFDLIHERLVLIHLPQRDDILRKLVDALKPGGWLVVEEFDVSLVETTFTTRNADSAALVTKMSDAMNTLMVARGVDRNLGGSLYERLIGLGLTEVGAAGSFVVGHGRSAATRLLQANFQQVRSEAVSAGLIADAEVDRVIACMDDPDTTFNTPMLMTAWGRRT